MNDQAGMKSLVLAPFTQTGLARLGKLGQVSYEPWTATRTLQDPLELGQRVDKEHFGALVVEADFLFEEIFQTAPKLLIAGICRGALNHVDLDAATDYGVPILHTPGRNARSVAELVIAQMFALARHTIEATNYVSDLQWNDPVDQYTRFQGIELGGRTLGVIGLGAIGNAVARLACRLGMTVLAHDPYVHGDQGKIRRVSLSRLLKSSDFVSIHIPDNVETAGMMDANRIASMRDQAYFINVSSPSVVDNAALASAVNSGHLAGAAIDVHEAHPIPPDSPFLGMANVILTPHIGGSTAETIERHSAMLAADIERAIAGRKPKHLANPAVWPIRRR